MGAEEIVAAFRTEGYAVVRGLFTPTEVEQLRGHYMALRARGSYPGDTAGVDAASNDPLLRYPRMIHMHRWDETSLRWLLDPRLALWLERLLGEPALATQTMLYFKPPGARGQALHQDQFYLKAHPGTCMAAWLALDATDEENGCLCVVPRTGGLPVLCTRPADTTVSFTDVTVPLPEGVEAVPVCQEPGDVLFFNGSLIHGSGPNRSATRFRRALIGHYVTASSREVARFYHPVLRMDGSVADLGMAEGGGPCGEWREHDGSHRVELVS
jgi:phytanoyl-CoA hydroxylase